MSLIKTSIEDVAFCLWDGEDSLVFAGDFLEVYPGFDEHWTVVELSEALLARR